MTYNIYIHNLKYFDSLILQYKNNFSPSYFTRVAWPMLKVAKITNDENIQKSAINNLDQILKKVKKNYMIRDCGFKPNTFAFLHTISYTIRGFLESSLILNREDYWDTAYDLSFFLLRKYEINKRLGGAYYENLQSINWYRCLTGELQLAIIWLRIFQNKNDFRFLNAASKLLDNVCETQLLHDKLFFKKGGIMGSKPFFGRYISLRQPNWATKFFIDALLIEEKEYNKIK